MQASSFSGAVLGSSPLKVLCRPGFACKLRATHYCLQRRGCRNLCRRDRHGGTITATSSASTQTDAQQFSQNLPDSREQAVKLRLYPGTFVPGSAKRYRRCLQVKQASDAVIAQLDASGSSKSKGFKTSSVKKLMVDIPVADQTAPAVRMLHA